MECPPHKKGKRVTNKRYSFRKNFLCSFVYLVLLNVCFQLYVYMTSFTNLEDFIKAKQTVATCFCILVFLLASSTIFLLVFSRFQIWSKLCLFACNFGLLFLIWYWNQGAPLAESVVFEYGYYTSRAVVLLYTIAVISFLFVLYPNIYLYFKCKRIAIIFWIIFGIGFMSTISFHYVFRVQYYRNGLFGEKLDISKTKCRVDDDTFIISHYLPRPFFQLAMLTYFCKPDVKFVELDDTSYDDDRFSTVKIRIDMCRNRDITVTKIPNLVASGQFSWEDMKSVRSYPYFPRIHLSIPDKKVMETIRLSKEDRKLEFYTYTYDSEFYETVIFSCGPGKRNVIATPKRSRLKKERIDRLLPVSKKNPNVIILSFDSLSRKDFEKGLPKTISYLQSISQFSNDDHKKKIDYYQFFNYKSVGSNSYGNLQAFFMGKKEDNNVPIYYTLKQNGYVTIHSDNVCSETSSLYIHVKNPAGMYQNETYLSDYVHVEPFCDPSFTDMKGFYNPTRGPSGSCRRCLFQKRNSYEYVTEYAQKMVNLFPNHPKFMFLGSMDAHEATGESITYIDSIVSNFFQFLERKGELERSIVIIFSDHGNIISVIQNPFKEGRIQTKHPVLGLIFPKGYLSDDQKNTLSINQHRIISHFDMHRTMMDVTGLFDGTHGEESKKIGYKQNKIGMNLLDQVVPYDRNCSAAGIPENHLCDIVCS